jgi:inner membrane protein
MIIISKNKRKIEMMTMDAMWIWAAIGVILLVAEIASATFYLLWFGIAALCVAIAVWLFPSMSYAVQLLIFAVLSVGSLAIWKIYYKKTETNSRVGQAQGEEIGRTGTVIAACSPSQIGKIRFTQGLMGSREWDAVANEAVAEGVEARVIAVEGHSLRIQAV